MNKLIIDNRTELSDEQALSIAKTIVEQGRISGDSYCLLTIVKPTHLMKDAPWLDVLAWRNKKSDTFRIMHHRTQ